MFGATVMRFNPPPNWPAPAPGWYPPPGWQPPAEWGPVPHGWPLWVNDVPAGYVTSTPVSRFFGGIFRLVMVFFALFVALVAVLIIAGIAGSH